MSANHDHFTWKAYVINGLILASLMVLTIVASWIHLPYGLNFPVALGIAITKMTFILLIFMNVWKSSSLAKLFAGAGFFWFLILIAFTFADFSVLAEVGTPTTSPIP